MTGKTISQLPAKSALLGNEWLEASGLSPTVTITATTISTNATDNSFNDSASGFITAGFAPGDRVNIRGASNASNNIFTGVISSCTSGKIIIAGTEGDAIVTEAAGSIITISKWVSSRMIPRDISREWYYSPPSTASLTLLNTGGTDLILTDDADVGLLVDAVLNSGSNASRMALRTLSSPTLDWTLTVRLDTNLPSGANCGIGLVAVAPDNTHMFWGLRGNENLMIIGYNASGASSSTGAITSTTENSPLRWFRMVKTGTNFQFFISAEGKLWVPVTALVPISTHLPANPNRAGLIIQYSAAADWKITACVQHFSLTGPAV